MSKVKLFFTLILLMSNAIVARNTRYQNRRYTQPTSTQESNYSAASYEGSSAQEQEYGDYTQQTQPINDESYDSNYYNQSASGGVRELRNKRQVDEALNSSRPTIIYCSAPWCTACTQMMEPVINQAANKYGGSIDFCKLDYDKFKSYAGQLGIQGLPHTIFRHGGKTITMSGSRPAGYFMNQVEAFRQGRMQPEQTTTKSISSSSAKKRKSS